MFTKHIVPVLLFFFNTSTCYEQRCSILSTSIHEDVAKSVSLHKQLKSANTEYWQYKPEIVGDEKLLGGSTQHLTVESFKKDNTFEFCARYKGALTHFDDRFYCCGGSSAYHFDKIKSEDIISEKKFLPCFSRSSTSHSGSKFKNRGN